MIASGGLSCDRNAQPSTRIGYQHIKDRRLTRPVPLSPGDFVGDYVPFYFAPRSPMLFVIHKGSVPGYSGGQTEVVHLVSTIERVEAAGLGWVFTDGHAEMAPLTDFYDDLTDLNKVDWELMQSRYWFDTDDYPDRMRRRQAEFLVHGFFPWELVDSIGVCNEATAARVYEVLETLAHKPQVAIEQTWYY